MRCEECGHEYLLAFSCYSYCTSFRLLPHGQQQIKAAPGKSLMEVLMNERIFLRSACGGKGTCGQRPLPPTFAT